MMKAGKLLRPLILLAIFVTASMWPSISSVLANETCSHECCAASHVSIEVVPSDDFSCCSSEMYFLDLGDSKEEEQHRCQCYFCLHCSKSFLPFGYSWYLTCKTLFTDSILPPVVSGLFSAFLIAVWHPPLWD